MIRGANHPVEDNSLLEYENAALKRCSTLKTFAGPQGLSTAQGGSQLRTSLLGSRSHVVEAFLRHG